MCKQPLSDKFANRYIRTTIIVTIVGTFAISLNQSQFSIFTNLVAFTALFTFIYDK